MRRDDIIDQYFDWLCGLVCHRSGDVSYRKLLVYLHSVPFRWSIPKDENRAEDGISLRWRFSLANGYEEDADIVMDMLYGPCSVLEMMVALAISCEGFMDDPDIGDRTRQWFWGMITNLGLSSMYDTRYNRPLVEETIERLLDREYEPDGAGGLFRIRDCDRDLRDVEIWYQLCWYLDRYFLN